MRVVASVLVGLLLATVWQFKTFTLICAVVAWLHIWWSRWHWLAPTLAFAGVLLAIAALTFPTHIAGDWLLRGTSLVIAMTFVTAVGFNDRDYAEAIQAA